MAINTNSVDASPRDMRTTLHLAVMGVGALAASGLFLSLVAVVRGHIGI